MAVSTISRRQLCAEASDAHARCSEGRARGVHSDFWLDAKESSHIYGESHGVLGDVKGKAGVWCAWGTVAQRELHVVTGTGTHRSMKRNGWGRMSLSESGSPHSFGAYVRPSMHTKSSTTCSSARL